MPERKEAVYVLISPEEDVDAVIARLRPLLPATVHLHIPANASAFQDFEDFRKLKGLISLPGTSITVAAEDKAIERLAHLLGFPVTTFSPQPSTAAPSGPVAREQSPHQPLGSSTLEKRQVSRLPILLSLAVALVVLTGVALLVTPNFVTAQILVKTKTDTLTQQVYLALTPEGGSAPEAVAVGNSTIRPIPVAAKAVEVSSEISGEGIAHGSKTVPDKPASGRVRLSNPNPFPVSIKAGSAVATVRGVQYVTTADITVPAADPFGSGVLGAAEVGITATAGGSATNLDARAIQTRLENGVYVINPEPISGGTDRKVSVVSAQDLQALREDLEAKLRGQLLSAIEGAVPTGYRLITETIKIADVHVEADQKEGAVADRFTMQLSASASGLAYRPEDLREAAFRSVRAAVAGKRLGEAVAVAREVNGSPFELVSTDPAVFGTRVTVTFSYQLDNTNVDNLKRALAGKSQTEAQNLLASLPFVASVQVIRNPGWMPGGLPTSPDRIAVLFEENQ